MANIIIPLRAIQGVFALIVMGLAAYCVDVTGDYPAAGFLVFASVWTFLVLAYMLLTPMFMPNLHHRWAVVGFEAVTTIFWFSGFIAQAASTRRLICLTASCTFPGAAKAAAAFAALEWLAWCGTLGLIIHAIIQYGRDDTSIDPKDSVV